MDILTSIAAFYQELSPTLLNNLLLSAIVVTLVILFRAACVSLLFRIRHRSRDERAQIRAVSRNLSLLIVVIALIAIWSVELRTLALSLVAVTLALVVATKELILCIMGSFVKSVTGTFKIGDRIQVGEHRGDVIDHTFLSTTLLELGPTGVTHRFTGRSIVLPNSIFVDTPVINESYGQNYVLHAVTLPISDEVDWKFAKEEAVRIGYEVSAHYFESAKYALRKAAERSSVRKLKFRPRATIAVRKLGEKELTLQLAVPLRKKSEVEQEVLELLLTRLYQREVYSVEEASSRAH